MPWVAWANSVCRSAWQALHSFSSLPEAQGPASASRWQSKHSMFLAAWELAFPLLEGSLMAGLAGVGCHRQLHGRRCRVAFLVGAVAGLTGHRLVGMHTAFVCGVLQSG